MRRRAMRRRDMRRRDMRRRDMRRRDLSRRAARAAGVMAHALNLYERAERHFQTSLKLAYQLEDDEQIAATYVGLGILRRDQGRFDEALSFFDQAIPLEPERALKFPWQNKADVLLRLGRFDDAEALYGQAMALNRRIGDDEGLAHTLRGLGEIAWRRGDGVRAEECLHDSEKLYRKLDSASALSLTAHQLGNAARTRGDWREAAERYAEALAQMDRMGDRRGMCDVLTDCAHLAVATGHQDLAARWLEMARTGFGALGAKLTPYEEGVIADSFERCAVRLAPEALQQAMAGGERSWREADVASAIERLRELAAGYVV